jgi:RNA polymerase sigma-70 factor (ECF subfamily)
VTKHSLITNRQQQQQTNAVESSPLKEPKSSRDDYSDEIAAQLYEDNADSVAELFEKHNQELINYLNGYCLSQQDAKGIAQEAYVKMLGLDSSKHLDSTASYLRSYLFKTAKNIAIDRLRRNQVFNKISLELQQTQNTYTSETPEASAVCSEKIERLEKLIAELPPKCQTAFILYRFKNKSFKEIATTMQLTESMVRKYVSRAIVFCKQGLES